MVYKIQTGIKHAKNKIRVLTVSLISLTIPAVFVLSGGVANAATTVIYNNIPNSKPGNVPSVAFEATGTSEFGGQVGFAGTANQNPTVTVLMSSWGCETGHWTTDNCQTTPGSTFSEPITLNVYDVSSGTTQGSPPGSLITSVTKTFNIPFRPSADDTKCTVSDLGKWFDGTACYNGFATPISFNLNNTTLPPQAVISVAYNTSDYGATPYGHSNLCNLTTAGCGYDSLNVGTANSLTTGTYPRSSDAYQDTLYDSCSKGSIHPFGLDVGCWTGFQPAFKVEASTEVKQAASATGGVTLSNPRQQLSFEAHDNSNSSHLGNVNYTNFDANLHYNADLTCVNVTGNTAYFAYQIPPGNFVSGTWVVWKVVDGGSPGKGHDTAGFVVASDGANATSLCESGIFTPSNYTITAGNLVVH